AAVGHGDEVHARLDEPAREQAPLTERIAAVLIAYAVGLLFDIERTLGARRRDQRMRTLVEGIARLQRRRTSRFGIRLIAIHFVEHGITAFEASAVGRIGDAQIPDAEVRRARVLVHFERVVLIAEETRDAAVETAIDVAAELHEREHAVAITALLG